MVPSKQRLLDLLAMGRVANLPTVVSNVLLGCGIGMLAGHDYSVAPILLLPVLAGCALYLGGCFMNDWKDADWDARHRPERAIPAGRLPQRTAGFLAATLLLAGVSLAGFVNPVCLLTAGILAAFVGIYTWLHKRTAWSVLPMGLCRALLYVLGFLAQPLVPNEFLLPSGLNLHDTYHIELYGLLSTPVTLESVNLIYRLSFLLPVCLGLLAYIAGLSMFARHEATGRMPRTNLVCALLLLFLPVMTHSLSFITFRPWLALTAIAPFLLIVGLTLWRARKTPPKSVPLLLASIGLVDLIAALPLYMETLEPGVREPFHGLALIVPLAAATSFLLALLLQKIAPAT